MSAHISLAPGSILRCGGRDCVVIEAADLEHLFVRYTDNAELATVAVNQLDASPSSTQGVSVRAQKLMHETLHLISDKRWEQAKKRLKVLRPLLELGPYARGQAKVQAVAKELGRSPSTVYRWMAEWDKSKSIRVFLRLPREDKGRKRLDAKVDRLIRAVIKKEYLTNQRKMSATIVELVQIRCRKKKWPEPHRSTIVRRINDLQPRVAVLAREGRKAARGKHELSKGAHPEVLLPLQVGQLDHTPSDYCIVDEIHRKPIDGAQTLSVVLDIGTRCVTGFSLTLEAPSVRVAGACVAHAILPKEKFLQEVGVDAQWPCYGLMQVIYTDNASEFEAHAFLKACEDNGIEVRKRPKGAPNYAGHIESMFRTFLLKVHELEGSRFSNLQDRMEYDSQGRAVMTISEFRKWFTIFITKYYHQKSHSGLTDLPPIRAWERGVLGTQGVPGIGLPDRVKDEFRLRVDFLPGVERTVQDYGIEFDRHHYMDTVLRKWVGAADPDQADKKRKFTVKFDPHDMTEVYFLDPDIQQYFPIPAISDLSHFTRWENKAVKGKIRKDNRAQVDRGLIAEGLQEMREVVREAAGKTRKARRQNQRILESQRLSLPRQRQETVAGLQAAFEQTSSMVDDDDVVLPLPGAVVPVAQRRGGQHE